MCRERLSIKSDKSSCTCTARSIPIAIRPLPSLVIPTSSSNPAGLPLRWSASNVGSGFAWNHGDIQPEIARTYIGIVGPGVKRLGVTTPRDFFTDHVDLRPTLMMLTGLTDDYQHDGRVITEILDQSALPSSLKAHKNTLESLGQVYKQINAPFGQLAQDTLKISTFAITSTSNGDAVYSNLEGKIADWTAERDGIATQMKGMLEEAEFGGVPIDGKDFSSDSLTRARISLV